MEKEREKIERMLRKGKITKEQSEKLLKALEESAIAEKEKSVRNPKTKIISISIAVIALVIVGGLLAFCQPRDIIAESEKLYKKGIQLWREDETDEAIETLREVVDKYPKTNRAGGALMCIGKIYMGQSDYQEAIESFREAIEKYPSSRYGRVIVGAYARFYLGRCYIHEEKWDEAKRILNQLLEKYPESTDPAGKKLDSYARSLLEEIETKEIKAVHLPKAKLQSKQEEILLTSEEKAKALYTLGENYQLNKMYPQAIKEYEKLIKEYPKTTWATKAREQLKKLK